MNYFPIREKVQLPYQVFTFLPLTSFERNPFSRKFPNLATKVLPFGSVIEGVSNSFLWISYEGALLRFEFEFIRMKFFHISIATPNLRNDILGFLPNHSSHGVVSTDLDGALFNVNVAVSNA